MKQSGLYSNIETSTSFYDESERASYVGVSIKTIVLLGISIIIALSVYISLEKILANNAGAFSAILVVSLIVGTISAFVGRISDKMAKTFSVIYAICEGIALGTITRLVDTYLPSAGLLCVAGTTVVFGGMLILYATGVIRAGSLARRIAISLLMCGLLLTISTIVIILINPGITRESYFALVILIELIFLLYGVVTLVFNFREAQVVVEAGCAKDAEWSVALGMEISLVYIYIQLLRLVLIIAQATNKR